MLSDEVFNGTTFLVNKTFNFHFRLRVAFQKATAFGASETQDVVIFKKAQQISFALVKEVGNLYQRNPYVRAGLLVIVPVFVTDVRLAQRVGHLAILGHQPVKGEMHLPQARRSP